MDLSWFRDLEQLSKTGNFSQAAKVRNISQPAFSRRVKALEAWVGTDLVERGRHPVSLTSAGKQMLEASRQALERLEYERAQIIEAQSLPDKYVVTFGAQHSIGWRFFPAWLQAFENVYGAMISRLRAEDLQICIAALENREIDFAIAFESAYGRSIAEDSSLESIKIGTDSLVPVCKPGAGGEPLFRFDAEAGPRIPWLRFGESAPITRHIDPLLDNAKIRNRLSVVYENSMAGALRIRARDGDGVAWLPYSLVAPDLDSGVLVVTGKEHWKIDLEIRLLRNREHTNIVTRRIWAFLATRQQIPLI
ncbi:MAG: LysR substrate-binding domain-containing protein [Pseudomonadota bacterium]